MCCVLYIGKLFLSILSSILTLFNSMCSTLSSLVQWSVLHLYIISMWKTKSNKSGSCKHRDGIDMPSHVRLSTWSVVQLCKWTEERAGCRGEERTDRFLEKTTAHTIQTTSNDWSKCSGDRQPEAVWGSLPQMVSFSCSWPNGWFKAWQVRELWAETASAFKTRVFKLAKPNLLEGETME